VGRRLRQPAWKGVRDKLSLPVAETGRLQRAVATYDSLIRAGGKIARGAAGQIALRPRGHLETETAILRIRDHYGNGDRRSARSVRRSTGKRRDDFPPARVNWSATSRIGVAYRTRQLALPRRGGAAGRRAFDVGKQHQRRQPCDARQQYLV